MRSLFTWASLALAVCSATASNVRRATSEASDSTSSSESSYHTFSRGHASSAAGNSSATHTASSAHSSSASGSASSSSTSTASAASSSSTIFGDLAGLKGDTQCSSSMCVSAVVNGSTVEYVLQGTSSSTPGWMAMGFGTQMANAQMVIMWANSDGSVTLSQRTASGETMPTVDSSPTRTATSLSNLTSISGSSSYYGFSVPANSDTTQSIIWAYSSTNPGSSDPSASFQKHDDSGVLSLNLANTFSGSTSSSSGSDSSPVSLPLTSIQKKVIAHGVLCGVGFLIFLPFGALLARWLRTFTPRWFLGHSIIQVYIAGPLIISGVALGISAVSDGGSGHLNDSHRKWGVAIFVLYIVQCSLGALIHWVKPRPKAPGPRARPPQNYIHAILGLLILAFAFNQVHTGYKDEWPLLGRGQAPGGVNDAFIAWAVLLPLLYFSGLALLPRQFHQERSSATSSSNPHLSHYRSRSNSVGGGGFGLGAYQENKSNAEMAPSSLGHGDLDADNIGLTQMGRANQRTNAGGRWSNDKYMYESSHGPSTLPFSRR